MCCFSEVLTINNPCRTQALAEKKASVEDKKLMKEKRIIGQIQLQKDAMAPKRQKTKPVDDVEEEAWINHVNGGSSASREPPTTLKASHLSSISNQTAPFIGSGSLAPRVLKPTSGESAMERISTSIVNLIDVIAAQKQQELAEKVMENDRRKRKKEKKKHAMKEKIVSSTMSMMTLTKFIC